MLSQMHIRLPTGDVKYVIGIQGKGPGWGHKFRSCQHIDGI